MKLTADIEVFAIDGSSVHPEDAVKAVESLIQDATALVYDPSLGRELQLIIRSTVWTEETEPEG